MEHFDLKVNLGMQEIGSFVLVFLFGIVTCQAYNYFRYFSESDRMGLKLLALAIWVFELLHAMGTTSAFYTISIIRYNQPEKIFTNAAVGYIVATCCSGIVASLVQAVFTRWVKIVAGRVYLAYFLWFLSFVRLLGTVGMTVALTKQTVLEFQRGWLPVITWSIGLTVDVIIAAALTFNFISRRKEAVKSKRLLDRLIAMTLQTGLCTGLSTISVVICFLAAPHTVLWAAVGGVVAKSFSISFFASLNSRQYLKVISFDSSNLGHDSDQMIYFARSQLIPRSPSSIDTATLLRNPRNRDSGPRSIYYSAEGDHITLYHSFQSQTSVA